MPKISSHRITSTSRGYEYELDLDLKDAAIIENKVAFDVTAKRRPIGSGDWEKETVTVSFDFEEHVAHVSVYGETIGTIDLAGIDIAFEAPLDEAWIQIVSAYQGRSVETAIQMIPTDPIFGCLVKAGISTTVGQSIKWYNKTASIRPYFKRIRETIKCLGANAGRIIITATGRTFLCMVTMGFG